MKWLLVLAAALALLVTAWLLFGPSIGQPGSGSSLEIPPFDAPSSRVVESAAQFEKYHPTPENVKDGVRLLETIKDRLTVDEWGAVQKHAFTGWERIRRIPGHAGVEPFLEELMARFARWGTREDLESLIRSSNSNIFWKRQIDQGLGRAARTPVSAAGYRGSRLEDLVSAAIKVEDFERAGAYLSQAGWAEGISEEARAPAARLLSAIEAYVQAKSGTPNFPKLIEFWATVPPDPELRLITEKSGIRAARSRRESRDYTLLEKGMIATQVQPGAAEYWTAVLWGIAREAGKGIFEEEFTLAALAKSRAAVFGPKSSQAEFWKELQALTPDKTYPLAMWRVSCWKRVVRSTEDSPLREAALRKIIEEHLPYHPAEARKAVAELRPIVGEEVAARVMAAVEKELAAKEAEATAHRTKMEREKAEMPVRGKLGWLQQQLKEAKSKDSNKQLIANLERQIAELEKKLAQ